MAANRVVRLEVVRCKAETDSWGGGGVVGRSMGGAGCMREGELETGVPLGQGGVAGRWSALAFLIT